MGLGLWAEDDGRWKAISYQPSAVSLRILPVFTLELRSCHSERSEESGKL